MDLGLDDETAVLTASTSGLGKASAVALAREGANVVICGRTAERLSAAEEDVREAASGGKVLGVQADVTDPDDVGNVVDTAAREFGSIDHLVTSAGGPPSGPILDTNERDWYEAYDLLVMSVVRAATRVQPYLAASDAGTLTAITSRTVVEPVEGLVLSNAVRKAVVGFVKTVALEWAPDVRANVVLPGTHETPRIEELVEAGVARGEYEDYEEGLADWAADIPLGRTGEPRELGEVVAFLASDRASYVHGTTVPVDGGALRS